jgi:hypothetical protein
VFVPVGLEIISRALSKIQREMRPKTTPTASEYRVERPLGAADPTGNPAVFAVFLDEFYDDSADAPSMRQRGM